MSEFFGISVSQVPTSLIPPVSVDASLLMAFGCAPIHRLDPEQMEKVMPGNIVLCFNTADAGEQLGIQTGTDDFNKWGLSEAAFASFELYKKAPVIFANIFNPDIHNVNVTDETANFIAGKATLANPDIIGSVAVTDAALTAYVAGTDYVVNNITGVITVIEDSALETALASSAVIKAAYKYAAPELVTADDVIGGYDVATGTTTGLELVELAFPKFRMVPGILIAPNFSQDPTVAMIMAAKAVGINAVFNAVAYADLPTDTLTKYTDVPAYKMSNGLTSENLYLCWPKVRVGERLMNLATHAAGVTAVEDKARNAIPFSTPSNKNVQCQAAVLADGTEISLTLPQANFIRGNGIATMLNFSKGNTLWGAYTAAYPGNTDPKDSFLSSRRILAWYANGLILTWWKKVDDPNNRRLIQTIANSEQMNLDGLSTVGAFARGSTITPRTDDNTVLMLMAGMLTFHLMLGLIMPAQRINFNLEFDPYLLQNEFA